MNDKFSDFSLCKANIFVLFRNFYSDDFFHLISVLSKKLAVCMTYQRNVISLFYRYHCRKTGPQLTNTYANLFRGNDTTSRGHSGGLSLFLFFLFTKQPGRPSKMLSNFANRIRHFKKNKIPSGVGILPIEISILIYLFA